MKQKLDADGKPRPEDRGDHTPPSLNAFGFVEGIGDLKHDRRCAMRPADEFWADFRERARRLPRAKPRSVPVRLGRPLHWAIAAAAVLVLSLSLRYAILPDSRTAGISIEIVETSMETGSFMIWEDVRGEGTIVWLMDRTPPEINGG